MIIAGLIGAGRMGKLHGENMVLNLPGVLLKAVAGHNLDEQWSGNLNIPVCAQDESAVLDDPEIEAVVIAASSTNHVALIKAERADPWGNLTYRMAARNFSPAMCMAAEITVVQAREIVELGAIEPEHVVTPGIFVDRVVEVAGPISEAEILFGKAAPP